MSTFNRKYPRMELLSEEHRLCELWSPEHAAPCAPHPQEFNSSGRDRSIIK